MTEQDWNDCTDPTPMLECLRGKVSDRKLRLFAAACFHYVRELEDSNPRRILIEVFERVADGKETRAQLMSAREDICSDDWDLGSATRTNSSWECARAAVHDATMFQAHVAHCKALDKNESISRDDALLAAIEVEGIAAIAEHKLEASLIRCIFGNPFRPTPVSDHWPPTVVQLAQAQYNGQDCSFALHDALLEAGHADLAEHFSKEQWHPKGC